jgi:hypothetical protein
MNWIKVEIRDDSNGHFLANELDLFGIHLWFILMMI